MLIGGSPGVLFWVHPHLPCVTCTGSSRYLCGAPSSASASSGFISSPFLICCALGAHAAVQGGVPLPLSSGCTRCMCAAWNPPPPACARIARAAWAGVPLLHPGLGRAVGSRTTMFGGLFLVPRCAPWERAAGLCPPPPPSPPLAAARFNCAQPFEGSPCLVPESCVASRRERAL